MSTAIPIPTLGPNGFEAPAESVIRTGVFADLNAAFGGALNPDETTPQGQMSDSETALLGALNDLYLFYTNSVDPAFASGRMQDAIARIYYLSRLGPLPTVVTATLGGAAQTPVPAGSLARATDGTIFQSLGAVVIPNSGTIDVEFAALSYGPVPCPAGSLDQIYRAVPGWDTVTNADAGTLGRLSETRTEFEARRISSVAINAIGILPAIRGTLLNVAGVLDAYVVENDTNATVVKGGVTLPANSLYVAVTGGTDADVARAIWTKKPPGCSYYTGNTTITVQDTEGYAIPYPAYDVTFERPASLPIFVDVVIADNTSVPSDATAQIRAAVLAAFPDIGKIGSTLFASRFICPIAALGSWAQVVSVQIGITSPGALDSYTARIDQQPTLDALDVTVSFV